ncbi:FAD/NAD(P)-binding protein [Halobacillus sp. Marseille-Q1614]|uniref:FAD/NAD(P)-binding protein n=1 Tax=Halobacillus sp. Marseille-Q1614 TaxID=2709134 RepID=UPI00156FD9EB|nr:FAD/NAD(P)-binding protein [Halobacillus sp. Marseille-Q1614]
MYQWVIIGGGIHGCTIAAHLLHSSKVKTKDLLIIDPFHKPIEKWKRMTGRVGMEYLRSPSVHHLHPDPYSLKSFAQSHDYAGGFKGYYKRPRLDMFNDHCDQLFKGVELSDCWENDRAVSLTRQGEQWKISTASHREIVSKQVVLALGVNDQPHYPDWAKPLHKKAPHLIGHIFSEQDMKAFDASKPPAIVGAGITAVHLAIKCSLESSSPVSIIKRHPFRIEDFDSDPGWLGPKYLSSFNRVSSYEKRRTIIQKARNRGSVTQSIYSLLKRLEAQEKIKIITADIESARVCNEKINLKLEKKGELLAESLLLATGAASCLPGKELLEQTIQEHRLPCAPCGFPIINKQLEWTAGLFTAGALAELEIGPAARNIAGARKAAQRIVQAI